MAPADNGAPTSPAALQQPRQHSGRRQAQALLTRVAEQLPPGEVPSVDITPVIGAHIGPGAVGFALIQAAKP